VSSKKWAEKRRSEASVFQERSSRLREADITTVYQWSCSKDEARVSSKKMGRKTEKRSVRFSGTSFNPEVAPGIAEQWFP